MKKLSASGTQFADQLTGNEIKAKRKKLPVNGKDMCHTFLLLQVKRLHCVVNVTQVQVFNDITHLSDETTNKTQTDHIVRNPTLQGAVPKPFRV